MKRTLEPEVMDTIQEANEYAAMDHSGPNAAFVERLQELGAEGRMLDIGTGPGHMPLLVCAEIASARVTGIDLAETMLVHARAQLAESPFADRVQFELADAKNLKFEAESFDVVFSNTILHHIPQPAALLREARRVLKPSGVLLIRDLMRPETDEEARALVDLHASDASERQRGLFLASLHAALTADEFRKVASQSGFDDAAVVIDSDRHMSLQLKRAGF